MTEIANTIELKTPDILKQEHKKLHEMLQVISQLPGKTGEKAREIVKLMQPHFEKEEEYAMPPLGLLKKLASGEITKEMNSVLPLTNRLQEALPIMLNEHVKISAVVEELVKVASRENQPEALRFANKLLKHAKEEEEFYYPAAILIGKYLKLKLGEQSTIMETELTE